LVVAVASTKRGVHACLLSVLSAAAMLLPGGCGDEDRRFNPLGVSVKAAQNQLRQGKLRCVRVAGISG
jgi:hypothetical protein